MTKIRVLDRMIGFISSSVTSSFNHNYNAIAILHTFSSSLHTHQNSPSSLVVSMYFNTETNTSNHYEVFLPFLI
jgi:hypothetical protein